MVYLVIKKWVPYKLLQPKTYRAKTFIVTDVFHYVVAGSLYFDL